MCNSSFFTTNYFHESNAASMADGIAADGDDEIATVLLNFIDG